MVIGQHSSSTHPTTTHGRSSAHGHLWLFSCYPGSVNSKPRNTVAEKTAFKALVKPGQGHLGNLWAKSTVQMKVSLKVGSSHSLLKSQSRGKAGKRKVLLYFGGWKLGWHQQSELLSTGQLPPLIISGQELSQREGETHRNSTISSESHLEISHKVV